MRRSILSRLVWLPTVAVLTWANFWDVVDHVLNIVWSE